MILQFLKRHGPRQIAVLFIEEYLGTFLRYIPGYEGMLLRRALMRITFRRIGSDALIWPSVFITHGYNIEAGVCLAVNWGTHIDGRGGITIGNHVLIGPNSFVGSSNHHVRSSPANPRIFMGHKPKPVVIGSNVWISANVAICPGAVIGDDCVIGAGAVVRGVVPPGSIVTGPAATVIGHFGET